MTGFRIKKAADEDIETIMQYLISQDAFSYFLELMDKLEKNYNRLKIFPLSGTKVNSARFKNFRWILVDKYYVFYTYRDNTVSIETILHTARNYKKVLEKVLPE